MCRIHGHVCLILTVIFVRQWLQQAMDVDHNEITQPLQFHIARWFLKFKKKTLFFKSWIVDGIVATKNLKLRNGILDVVYLYNIVKDKRNFHSEVNMLNAAMKAVNITISNEPVLDTSIQVYCHHSDEIYNWIYRKAKYYYNHIIQDIVEHPTSEKYWENVLGLRVTEHFLHTSYACRVKNVKDKKLAETNFKVLNNILPCNRNLFKWGKVTQTSVISVMKKNM